MNPDRRIWWSLVIALTVMVLSLGAGAEEAPESEAPDAHEEPEDVLNRETPRGSVSGYLEAANDGDFEKAARYLDRRNLPKAAAAYSPELLARRLKIILDRTLWVDLDSLSDDPEGFVGDDLPRYRDALGEIEFGRGTVTLYMQRVPTDRDLEIWKISNHTVARIPELYAEWGYPPVAEWMRRHVPDVRFLDIELFKWLRGLIVAVLATPIMLAIGWALARVLTINRSQWFPDLRRFFMGPVTATVVVVVSARAIASLGIGGVGYEMFRTGTFTTIGVTWVLVVATTMVIKLYADFLRRRGRSNTLVLLKPIGASIKTLIVVLALLVWLDNAGFQITALLAGLGIGGVAVALVLQKPLEDVFGAISLYTQQPIRIGDYGMFAGIAGTIEEITLRNTRVRTLANTLITIPNAKLAAEPIENYSAREKILFRTTLRVRTDSAPDRVRDLLRRIQELLHDHERIIDQGARVRLVRIGVDAIELEVFAYVATRVFVDYLEIAEELNLALLDAVAAAGTTLAVPTQTLMLESAPSSD